MSHNEMTPSTPTPDDTLAIVWTDAGHPDEGSLQTWLDDAFDAATTAQVQAHVTGCAVCQREVATLRGYMAATSRILGALDDAPGGVVSPADTAKAAAAIVAQADVRTRAEQKAAQAWFTRPAFRMAAALALMAGGTTWVMSRTPVVDVKADRATATAPATAPATTPVVAVAPESPAPAPAGAASAAMAPVAAAPRAKAQAAQPLADVAAERANVASAKQVADVAVASDPTVSGRAVAAMRSSIASSELVAPTRVVVRGTVRDGSTQRPIEGVQIQAMLAGSNAAAGSTVTSMSGAYAMVIAGVTGNRSIRVTYRRIGYTVATAIRAASGDTLVIDQSMSTTVTALSEVIVSEQEGRREKSATARQNIMVGPASKPIDQDFSGRGVAGGIARGVAAPVSPSTIRPRDYPRRDNGGNREQYDKIDDNPFLAVSVHPRSTFSVDVDRASYSNVRRFIAQGQTPPPDAVRIEELINYFPYDLPSPTENAPVSITTETMAAPWQPNHRLVRVALQARRIETAALPPSNLVFLIDVSGSMNAWNKLPLVKASLRLLVDQLRPQDHVALVVYAGAAGLVLPSTSGDEKSTIVAALDRLEAGGSTAGGAGIELAYRTAHEHFKPTGNNRVILATDGDFNVGASSDGEMERLIERKRAEGTYLTVLGFGEGNYQDAKMEKLAKRGNGNYAYVDDIAEARKVLVHEMGATLVTVANDVKLQVEFNPATVRAYRLIGYEDRLLATEDFTDDKKDAGDMGAGHSVTALYEVVPNGVTGTITLREQDSLRYQVPATDAPRTNAAKNELMFVRMRYKTPGENTSRQITQAVIDGRGRSASNDFRFAASVAEFGMVLRDSEHKGTATLRSALAMATAAQGSDAGGYRAEFVSMLGRLLNGERR
jgi:Ca-activated chloride channel family protein